MTEAPTGSEHNHRFAGISGAHTTGELRHVFLREEQEVFRSSLPKTRERTSQLYAAELRTNVVRIV